MNDLEIFRLFIEFVDYWELVIGEPVDIPYAIGKFNNEYNVNLTFAQYEKYLLLM